MKWIISFLFTMLLLGCNDAAQGSKSGTVDTTKDISDSVSAVDSLKGR
jgi:hypothetical protein